ncbi:MAG: 50S ribosomal protein L30e, partial [Acidilobaceae archaeon]
MSATVSTALERELKNLIKSGRYYLGYKKSLKALARGEARLIIVASGAPPAIREKALYYAKLSGTPVMVYEGRSVDLGGTIGKPFPVSIIAVVDPGTSRI